MPTGITNSSRSPQGPSTQRQVSEKGPEGAWALGGLSEEAPVFHQHEVLQPSKGGQRALDQLPGREWLSPPLPIMLLAQSVLDAFSWPTPLSPSRNQEVLWAAEAIPPAPQSAPHRASSPGKGEALKATAGRV